MALKYTRWLYSHGDKHTVEQLMDAGYPYLVSSVLAARGISTVEEANVFLERETRLAYSPFLMKDMDKAVSRINAAIAAGEKIAVFGDYDVDGITATVLLVDYLRSRGADCVKYIPRRVEDGYGLGQEPMRHLREQGVDLLITVDCGITGVEEAEYAKQLGLDLIITDHHECKDVLPDAAAVVDPHRSDCPYPFKQLAGVGVALKLVLALGGESQEDKLFARYCTLAAIGTVADVMQMSDENRTIVLKAIRSSDFLGLHALLKETGLLDKAVTSIQIGFVLAPRINAAGRMGEAELAADLLLTDDPNQAEKLARQLCQLNRERQSVEQEIFAQAIEQIKTIPDNERSALVLSSEEWHQGVVGIVASRLAEKFSCPSFMIHLSDGMGKCSCRSYGGFNLFAALESCSDLLEGFGGHELAAGFTIKEENIPAFRRRINRCASAFLGGEPPVSSLDVDVVLHRPELVTLEEVDALRLLEPYGAGNNRPVFCFQGAKIESMQSVGQNRHLKLRLSRGKYSFDAIYFSANRDSCGLEVGDRVDAAFYLQVNEFRGSRTVQLQMIDLRGSATPSAREQECLELASRLRDCVSLTPQEAARMLPGRDQFVHLWQAVIRLTDGGGPITVEKLPALRRLASAMRGAEPFLRTAVGLSVFAERHLLVLDGGTDCLTITVDAHEKVNLGESLYVRRLHQILGLSEKGGV